jgi:hypothetical protein
MLTNRETSGIKSSHQPEPTLGSLVVPCVPLDLPSMRMRLGAPFEERCSVPVRHDVRVALTRDGAVAVVVCVPDEIGAKVQAWVKDDPGGAPNGVLLEFLSRVYPNSVNPLLLRATSATLRGGIRVLINDAAEAALPRPGTPREVLRSLRRLFRSTDSAYREDIGSSIPVFVLDGNGNILAAAFRSVPERIMKAQHHLSSVEKQLREHATEQDLSVEPQIIALKERFAAYRRCIDLAQEGKSGRKISGIYGIHKSRAAAWISNRKSYRSLTNDPRLRKLSPRLLSESTLVKEDAAFLLGALSAGPRDVPRKRISIKVKTSEGAQRIEKLLDTVVGPKKRSSSDTTTSVLAHSRALCREVRHLTANRNQVPWDFLRTDGCIITFLQGFLAVRGTYYRDVFSLPCGKSPALAVDIASAFQRLDIYPRVWLNENPIVAIADTISFKKIAALDY